jgi:integrase
MSVQVEEYKGRLRLRWRCAGERYCLSPGLDADNKTNWAIAQMKAAEIEQDMARGIFDPTLAKYKMQTKVARTEVMGAVELWQKYVQEVKTPQLPKNSLEKYKGLTGHLQSFFQTKAAAKLSGEQALAFRQWLSERNQPGTVRERIIMLKAAWKWAIQKKWLSENPWDTLPPMRVGDKPKPKPFSPQEIGKILVAFRSSQYYAYYCDFVEFLLGSGCRPGEAIALRWRHVRDDFASVWIGESRTRGVLKTTKNTKTGDVPLSNSLRQLLQRRKSSKAKPDDLVFPAARGGYIDDKSFRVRAWITCLEAAGVEYRKPYSCRSTLISYWLSQGEDPMVVAKYTRTSVKMIYEHYAGWIPGRAQLPEILADSLETLESSPDEDSDHPDP